MNKNMIEEDSNEDSLSRILKGHNSNFNQRQNYRQSQDKPNINNRKTNNQNNLNNANNQSNINKTVTQVNCSTITNCLYSFIKKVKSSPLELIQYLQKRSDKYDRNDSLKYYPINNDSNFAVITEEGKNGVQNLVQFIDKEAIKNYERIDIEWSDQLHRAAMKRAEAIQNGNQNVQEMDVGELVNQFTQWRICLSQITVNGFIDPKQIIIQALLQDGSHQKSNRQNFFNPSARFVGIGMAHHPVYKIVVVIIFAGGFKKPLREQAIRDENSGQNKCVIY